MVLALLGLSIPAFVVGPVLIAIFAIAFDWLPAAGLGSATHLILPVITLALPFCGRIARLARAGMLDVIHQDYVRTARAKGLSEGRIVIVHVLRGGLLPVVSFLGPTTAQVLTGSLVVEQIFAIPGLGHLFINSAEQRDYPVVLGAVIVFGAILIATNLLADIVSAIVDPRIRLA